jgi:hypothetical protein
MTLIDLDWNDALDTVINTVLLLVSVWNPL